VNWVESRVKSALEWVNGTLFGDLSRRSREHKVSLLRERFRPEGGTRILDLGSEVDRGQGQILELFAERSRITAANLRLPHLRRISGSYARVQCCAANALQLPFADKSFDLVYSNAVIEHVGGFEQQRAMAREVMRVGRNWFITTPNRWYPFEFHMRLPLVSWLPAPQMKQVGALCSYSHVERRYKSGIQQQIRLITRGELGELFPASRVVALRVTFWPETLVALGGTDLGGGSTH
jgi:hypothetical protein